MRDAARDLVGGIPDAPWLHDEAEFLRHFGASYADYAEVVNRLTRSQAVTLERTLAVNPEAAVLWVLNMDLV